MTRSAQGGLPFAPSSWRECLHLPGGPEPCWRVCANSGTWRGRGLGRVAPAYHVYHLLSAQDQPVTVAVGVSLDFVPSVAKSTWCPAWRFARGSIPVREVTLLWSPALRQPAHSGRLQREEPSSSEACAQQAPWGSAHRPHGRSGSLGSQARVDPGAPGDSPGGRAQQDPPAQSPAGGPYAHATVRQSLPDAFGDRNED